MKKILVCIVVVIQCVMLKAQTNVGIGTATPNASAKLDIVSTTQGLLVPRMTTSQRNGILSPATGLIVYETTFNRFYIYDGTAWKYLINNDLWTGFTGAVYNIGDNVGINTAAPAEKLDVFGNIRVSGNIGDASGNLKITGSLGIGTNSPQEKLHIHNGNVLLNNTNPILQLQNSGVDKGFLQLSGDHLRIGTNSGNTAGKFVIRNNGGDRIFVNADGEMGINITDPLAFLHINSGAGNSTLRIQGDNNPTLQFYKGTSSIGSIQVSGDDLRFSAPGNNVVLNGLMYVDDANNRVGINTSTPDNNLHVQGDAKVTSGKIYNNDGNNMLPVAWGKFGSSGSRLSGTSNITAETINTSLGEEFRITVAGVDLTNAAVLVSIHSNFQEVFSTDATGGKIYVTIRSLLSGDYIHSPFSIVIYK